MSPLALLSLVVAASALTCPSGFTLVSSNNATDMGYCGKNVGCNGTGYTYDACASMCASSTSGGQVYSPPLADANAWTPTNMGTWFGCGMGTQATCADSATLTGLDCWLGAKKNGQTMTTAMGETCNLGTPRNCSTLVAGSGSTCPQNSWRACDSASSDPAVCGSTMYNSFSAQASNDALYIRDDAGTCNQNSFRSSTSTNEVCVCGVPVYGPNYGSASGVATGTTCGDCNSGSNNNQTLSCTPCSARATNQNAKAMCGCPAGADNTDCCTSCYNDIACGRAPFNGVDGASRANLLDNFQCGTWQFTKDTDCSDGSKKGLLGLLGLLGLIPLLLCSLLLSLLLICCKRNKRKGEPVAFATMEPQSCALPVQQCMVQPSFAAAPVMTEQPCFGAAPVGCAPTGFGPGYGGACL